MDLKKVVDAYIACGKKHGFFVAEMILDKYTPGVMESKCFQVPEDKRSSFVSDLKLGMAALKK